MTFDVSAKTVDGKTKQSKIEYVDSCFGGYAKYESWDSNFTTYLLTVMFGFTASEMVGHDILLKKVQIAPNIPLTPSTWIHSFMQFYRQKAIWPTIRMELELISKEQSKMIEWLSTFHLAHLKDKFCALGGLVDTKAIIEAAGIELCDVVFFYAVFVYV